MWNRMLDIRKSGESMTRFNLSNSLLFVLIVTSMIFMELLAFAYAADTVLASNYIAFVCKKIREHWHPPPDYAGQSLIVSFRVYRNGSISNLTCKAVNDPKYVNWRAAMIAVRSSLPFPCPAADFFQKNRQSAEVSIDLSAINFKPRAVKNPLPLWGDQLRH